MDTVEKSMRFETSVSLSVSTECDLNIHSISVLSKDPFFVSN